MDATLVAMCTDTVEIAAPTGPNAWGEPQFAAPVSYPARVEERLLALRRPDGTQVVATTRVFLPDAPAIDPQSRVTLADGRTLVVLQVSRLKDERGGWYVTTLVAGPATVLRSV